MTLRDFFNKYRPWWPVLLIAAIVIGLCAKWPYVDVPADNSTLGEISK